MILFSSHFLWQQMYREQEFKNAQPLWYSLPKSGGEKSLEHVHLAVWVGGGDTGGDSTGRGGMFDMGGGGGLATSCVSCCSCVVKAARVVLMLFLEMFCLSISLWRWCCRYPKASVSQTSFGHISTNSLMILTVSTATESPWKDLSIDTSHASKRSVLAKILGRSTGNHHGTIY